MTIFKHKVTRRKLIALTGLAAVSQCMPAFAAGTTNTQKTTRSSFTLFYKPEFTGNIWDTWIYYHEGRFYLYYNPSPYERKELGGWNSVALATSNDGVHWQEHGKVIEAAPGVAWLGAGAVWPAGEKFTMNFSELQKAPDGSEKQTIFFAESHDLVQWQRLGSEHAFSPDTSLYEDSRWDNIWPVARSEGGYYGYWAAVPKNKQIGIGFGESDDGITWRALPSAMLEEVPIGPPGMPTPEVCAAYYRQGKYYLLLGLDDLKPIINEDAPKFRPGITTLISDSANGPFRPAPKNRRLLVCNASYFMRFVTVGDEVLVNHHSWELDSDKIFGLNPAQVYMAPIKKAQWDDEGSLRLMWWEQNNLAKGATLSVSSGKPSRTSQPSLLTTLFDPQETLILEGTMPLPGSKDAALTGLYLQGTGDTGTAFLVRENGAVDYGSMRSDGTGFEKQGNVDRELPLKNPVRFRLVRKGQLTEFYLNDYLMQNYSLPEMGTGRIGLIGFENNFGKLKAWYCA